MRPVLRLGRSCAHYIHRRFGAKRESFWGWATSWRLVLPLAAAAMYGTEAGAADGTGAVAQPGGPRLFGFIHAQFEDPGGSGETRPFARRMRLGVRGELAQHLGYEVSAELTASNTDLPRSAFVEYRGWRPALLRVGEFKLPYSLEAYESSNVNQFIDRALAVEQIAFTHDRDTGFSARSPADPRRPYGYHLALVNGAGRNQLRATDVKLFVGRVHFHIAPPLRPGGSPLALGFSTRQGSVRNFNRPAGEQDEDERYGVDLEYQRGRWRLRGEYLWGRNGHRHLSGYYGWLSYRLSSPLELALRHEGYDADDGRTKARRTTVGLNYRLTEQSRAMLDYEVVNGNAPGEMRGGLRFRLQALFP